MSEDRMSTTSTEPRDGDQKIPHDRVLRRIRELLAAAERSAANSARTDTTPEDAAAFAAEAEAYSDKAARLLFEYQIDAATLALSGAATPANTEVVCKTIRIAAPYAREKCELARHIAALSSVHTLALYATTRNGNWSYVKGLSLRLWGTAADIEQFEMLFTSLLLQANRLMAHDRPANPREDLGTYRASWLLGFTRRIHVRLHQIRQAGLDQATGSGSGAELVLVDRAARAKQTAEATYGDDVKDDIVKSGGSGEHDGRRGANRADLGQHRVDEPAGRELAG
jgi:hypothetical protein